MSKTIWNKGAPPSIGWWPAGCTKNKEVIRWWNGKKWSDYAWPTYSKKEAALVAMYEARVIGEIEWSARWWL